MLQSLGSQRVRHDLATEQQQHTSFWWFWQNSLQKKSSLPSRTDKKVDHFIKEELRAFEEVSSLYHGDCNEEEVLNQQNGRRRKWFLKCESSFFCGMSGSSLTKGEGSPRWGCRRALPGWGLLTSSLLSSSLPFLRLLWYFYLNITITGPKCFIMQINSNHIPNLKQKCVTEITQLIDSFLGSLPVFCCTLSSARAGVCHQLLASAVR